MAETATKRFRVMCVPGDQDDGSDAAYHVWDHSDGHAICEGEDQTDAVTKARTLEREIGHCLLGRHGVHRVTFATERHATGICQLCGKRIDYEVLELAGADG